MIQRSRMRRLLVCVFLVFSLNLAPTLAQASSLRLDPISLSFPSPHFGYVISLFDCSAKTCATLRSTSDAASTWNVVPAPRQLNKDLRLISWGNYNTSYVTLNVHFADSKDGWIYGTVPAPVTSNTSNPNWVSRLWSTHDGGKAWRQVHLGPLFITSGVIQMATHGDWTYLFGASDQSGQAYVLATHSNLDQWMSKSNAQMEMPAGGTQVQGDFNFVGSSGWFVAGNDRGFTASARLSTDGSWRAWNGPSIPSSFCPIAAVTNRVLLADCQSAEIVIPPASSVPHNWNSGASWLFISYDAGTTFKPFRELSSSYQLGISAVPGLPATPIPGTILLQKSTNLGVQMIRSTNWGESWRVVLRRSISEVVFTNRTDGFAIVKQQTSQTASSLFATNDAGGKWREVSFGVGR